MSCQLLALSELARHWWTRRTMIKFMIWVKWNKFKHIMQGVRVVRVRLNLLIVYFLSNRVVSVKVDREAPDNPQVLTLGLCINHVHLAVRISISQIYVIRSCEMLII